MHIDRTRVEIPEFVIPCEGHKRLKKEEVRTVKSEFQKTISIAVNLKKKPLEEITPEFLLSQNIKEKKLRKIVEKNPTQCRNIASKILTRAEKELEKTTDSLTDKEKAILKDVFHQISINKNQLLNFPTDKEILSFASYNDEVRKMMFKDIKLSEKLANRASDMGDHYSFLIEEHMQYIREKSFFKEELVDVYEWKKIPISNQYSFSELTRFFHHLYNLIEKDEDPFIRNVRAETQALRVLQGDECGELENFAKILSLAHEAWFTVRMFHLFPSILEYNFVIEQKEMLGDKIHVSTKEVDGKGKKTTLKLTPRFYVNIIGNRSQLLKSNIALRFDIPIVIKGEYYHNSGDVFLHRSLEIENVDIFNGFVFDEVEKVLLSLKQNCHERKDLVRSIHKSERLSTSFSKKNTMKRMQKISFNDMKFVSSEENNSSELENTSKYYSKMKRGSSVQTLRLPIQNNPKFSSARHLFHKVSSPRLSPRGKKKSLNLEKEWKQLKSLLASIVLTSIGDLTSSWLSSEKFYKDVTQMLVLDKNIRIPKQLFEQFKEECERIRIKYSKLKVLYQQLTYMKRFGVKDPELSDVVANTTSDQLAIILYKNRRGSISINGKNIAFPSKFRYLAEGKKKLAFVKHFIMQLYLNGWDEDFVYCEGLKDDLKLVSEWKARRWEYGLGDQLHTVLTPLATKNNWVIEKYYATFPCHKKESISEVKKGEPRMKFEASFVPSKTNYNIELSRTNPSKNDVKVVREVFFKITSCEDNVHHAFVEILDFMKGKIGKKKLSERVWTRNFLFAQKGIQFHETTKFSPAYNLVFQMHRDAIQSTHTYKLLSKEKKKKKVRFIDFDS